MGSISSVWFGLIHIPFLGWILAVVLVAVIWFGLVLFREMSR